MIWGTRVGRSAHHAAALTGRGRRPATGAVGTSARRRSRRRRGRQVVGSRAAGVAIRPRPHREPCQRYARNCATHSLALPHTPQRSAAPLRASACSTTSPRSPTHATAVADGTHSARCWPCGRRGTGGGAGQCTRAWLSSSERPRCRPSMIDQNREQFMGSLAGHCRPCSSAVRATSIRCCCSASSANL